ncbi:MAG: diacylglycerol kinase [Candidatus Andersenbacteria bacterium]|nr:diacylglycerol kinase [bacterium]MDZ4225385.1 diacylglycerol kinase [Candidatus Andersenbacteria bacterium]
MRSGFGNVFHGRTGKSRSFSASVTHAVRGVIIGLWSEANVRRQSIVLLVVLGLVWWLRVGVTETVIVLLAAGAVLSLEMMNSAMEALADAVHPDYGELVQKAKDMMAGAVLIVSLVALVIGIVVFVPHLLQQLNF